MSLRDVSQYIPMWFVHWTQALGLTVDKREVKKACGSGREFVAALRSKNPDLMVYVSQDPKDIGDIPMGRSEASTLAAEIELMKLLIGNDLVVNHRYGNVLVRFQIPNLRFTR